MQRYTPQPPGRRGTRYTPKPPDPKDNTNNGAVRRRLDRINGSGGRDSSRRSNSGRGAQMNRAREARFEMPNKSQDMTEEERINRKKRLGY